MIIPAVLDWPVAAVSNVVSTDFSEYTTGAQPSDWTKRWDSPSMTWTVETGGSIGGKVLKGVAGSTGRHAISWDDAGTLADAEVLMKIRITSSLVVNQVHWRGVLRGANDTSTSTGYIYDMRQTPDKFEISRLLNGSFTGQLDQLSKNFTQNIWQWCRIRALGTTLEASIWDDGDTEPASFQMSTTDSGISTAGWLGVGVGRAGTAEVDFFSYEPL